MNLHQSRYLNLKDGGKLDLLEDANVKTCPVCSVSHENEQDVIWGFGDFSIVKCRECQVMHLSPVPNSKAIGALYNNNYYNDDTGEHGYADYAANEQHVSTTYKNRLKNIVKFMPKDKKLRVHEVGVALGYGLDVVKEMLPSAVITGSDISEESLESCKEKGFDCYLSDSVGRCDLDKKLDMLYLFDVIEHLTDVDGFLKWVDDTVETGGVIGFTTPDMGSILNKILGKRSPSIKIPQHIVYFTTETLLSRLNENYILKGKYIDFQYLTIGHLVSRVIHTLGIKPWIWLEKWNWPVISPTGMKLYVFQKQ